MTGKTLTTTALALAASLAFGPAQGEILAMMNYESKTADSLKALKITAPAAREEGIAILDVDPDSPAFGKILMQIPLPPDLVAHHIFFDRTQTKAYVAALGKAELHTFSLTEFPYRLRKIPVPGCEIGEDVIFSEDNSTWYLTCMGSAAVAWGDVATDTVRGLMQFPGTYPHGLAVHTGIDRGLVTSTVRASDLGDAGEVVSVFQPSSKKVLGQIKLSNKPSPVGEAPVELLFVPGANPPVVYSTNMFGASLWAATWNPASQDFKPAQAFDFAPLNVGVPLEMYFPKGDANRMYLTTAVPGHLHIFDTSNPLQPKLLKSLKAGEGAHHVGFTKDGKYAFVQNALLNLPKMSEGTITVVDLEKEEVVATIDTLAKAGLNPNSLVLLPQWNDMAGH